MSLCWSRGNDVRRSAVVKSSALRWSSLPHHDYIRRLVERFRQRPPPECVRRVVFGPDKIWCEYVSASFHLPGAYVELFPCPHCARKDEEECTTFVEVFHLANVHEPNFCATVTFAMPTDAFELRKPTGCSVEVEFTKGCPNAPIVKDHSPRAVLPIVTDVCIEVLRFLPRSELEKMLLVSRRWSNIIGWSVGSLQQRRCFSVLIHFYGESCGMLSIHFVREVHNKWRTIRVLTTRGLSQALDVVRSHLQNAFVESVLPPFEDHVPPPDPPREMLVDMPLPQRIDWLNSLLRSMPRNSEIGAWSIRDGCVGFDNLPAVARCALKPYRKLGRVRCLVVSLLKHEASGAQLTSLLKEPSIRGFRRIVIVTTKVAVETSELRDILSSWQSLQLHVFVSGQVESQDALLALPAQIIQDFVALRDVNSFVAEFSLQFKEPGSFAFPELPDVHEATDRRKRFRYHIHGEDTVARLSVYKNSATCEYLTVVTFDHFRRTVLFFKGKESLPELKLTIRRQKVLY